MKRQKRIIGAKVEVLEDIRSKGGVVIKAGEIVTIDGSYYGYLVKTEDGRTISRVEHSCVKFIEL
jgi:hypothetical protein